MIVSSFQYIYSEDAAVLKFEGVKIYAVFWKFTYHFSLYLFYDVPDVLNCAGIGSVIKYYLTPWAIIKTRNWVMNKPAPGILRVYCLLFAVVSSDSDVLLEMVIQNNGY